VLNGNLNLIFYIKVELLEQHTNYTKNLIELDIKLNLCPRFNYKIKLIQREKIDIVNVIDKFVERVAISGGEERDVTAGTRLVAQARG
jgi:hypothetical protein